jgi:hypothetical protein
MHQGGGGPYGGPYGSGPGYGPPQQGWGHAPAGGFAPAGYGHPPAGGGGYNFSQLEEISIRKVGGRSKTWGIISLIIGALLLLAGLGVMVGVDHPIAKAAGAAILAVALQPIISGWFYMQAGQAFDAVVDTHGDDIGHMMNAVGKLTNAVRVEAIVSILAVVLGFALATAFAGSIAAGNL